MKPPALSTANAVIVWVVLAVVIAVLVGLLIKILPLPATVEDRLSTLPPLLALAAVFYGTRKPRRQ